MKLFNWSRFKNSTEDLNSLCRKFHIRDYTINNGLIDIEGDVELKMKELKELPLKFGDVNGSFYCNINLLTTLKGSPQKVFGNFNCANNKLTSLEGSPQLVSKEFSCSRNSLKTLTGGPKEVCGDYYCSHNKLEDVRGFPEYYRGNVFIFANPVEVIIQLLKSQVWRQGLGIDVIIETLNDYNVIRNGKKVNLQLLKYVFDDFQLEFPNIEYIEGYEII